MSNEAGDKKLDHKEDIFQRFKSPRYISLHSKIEPAAINIYRDIIKVLLVTSSLSNFAQF